MKKSTKYIIIAAVFAAVMAGAVLGYNFLSDRFSPESGSDSTGGSSAKAYDFTVLDRNGKEVKLSDFFGKPVVVNFWATWCGPCKSELPAFDSVYDELGDEVEFLMVNLTDGFRETEKSVKEFISDEGYKFPVYFDTQYSAAYAYGVSGIPMSVFINADGTVSDAHVGAMSEEALRNYIDGITGG